MLEAAQEKAEPAPARARGEEPRKPARNRGHLPAHLARVERVVERVIEPGRTLCPYGCGEMARIGEEILARLDVIPAQVQALVTRHSQMLEFFRRPPPCLFGMEACASAHDRGREVIKFGHDVRLMPPTCVKGHVKR
ncbi:hypothetical protein KY389_03475, partial [Paracoccus bogoriensis]|nr:hypothetical protein [Paracoccus bogoriensis]